ncbi:MAG: hypothetical protein HN467_10345 [Opitutae bacterium]|nr:hypothetical protein [Opitutae bacterium]
MVRTTANYETHNKFSFGRSLLNTKCADQKADNMVVKPGSKQRKRLVRIEILTTPDNANKP